jgi:hypothetical protein
MHNLTYVLRRLRKSQKTTPPTINQHTTTIAAQIEVRNTTDFDWSLEIFRQAPAPPMPTPAGIAPPSVRMGRMPHAPAKMYPQKGTNAFGDDRMNDPRLHA